MERLIVKYYESDGCSYSSENTVPVTFASKEEFLIVFEENLHAYQKLEVEFMEKYQTLLDLANQNGTSYQLSEGDGVLHIVEVPHRFVGGHPFQVGRRDLRNVDAQAVAVARKAGYVVAGDALKTAPRGSESRPRPCRSHQSGRNRRRAQFACSLRLLQQGQGKPEAADFA